MGAKIKPELLGASLKVNLGYPNKMIRDIIKTSFFYNNEYQDNPFDERVINKGDMMVNKIKMELKEYKEKLNDAQAILNKIEETIRIIEDYVMTKSYDMWEYYLKDWGIINKTTTDIELEELKGDVF